jgi:CDP-diacylglycerol pyrophosphatase
MRTSVCIYSPSPCGRGLGGEVLRALFLAALIVGAASRQAAADSNALWHIVSEQCVPDQKMNQAPRPCAEVDLAAGYAVLKDLVGNTQFLLIPTTQVTGIESPKVLEPQAPNYFAAAWHARHFVEERVRHALPRDAIGLAINSVSGRSQNQLHIHVDCMRLDVMAALRAHASAIGTDWAKFPEPLVGHDYMAMRIEQPDLGAINPFVLLADSLSGARADMAHYTLVVMGANAAGKDGFIVLAGHATPGTGNWGAGEQLQDHACAAVTVASH